MKKFILALGALMACSNAFADSAVKTTESEKYMRPYVGLDYVYTSMEWKDDADSFLLSDSLNSFSVSGGIKFNKYIGGELFFQQSGDETETAFSGAYYKTKLNYMAVGLDIIGYLPAGKNFNFLGTVGAGYYKFRLKGYEADNGYVYSLKESKDKLGYRIGLGMQYDVNENLSLRAVTRYSDPDIDYIDNLWEFSFGVRMTF